MDLLLKLLMHQLVLLLKHLQGLFLLELLVLLLDFFIFPSLGPFSLLLLDEALNVFLVQVLVDVIVQVLVAMDMFLERHHLVRRIQRGLHQVIHVFLLLDMGNHYERLLKLLLFTL